MHGRHRVTSRRLAQRMFIKRPDLGWPTLTGDALVQRALV
jgi:hypothetical protein